jgi:hypothetical protein
MSEDEKGPERRISAVPGLAVLGLMVTGVTGIVVAILASSPLALFAATVAFGAVLWVYLGPQW